MKVLTFGWDFPPQTTGGLGFACHGLTKELTNTGVEVIFVLPRPQPVKGTNRFIFADVNKNVKVREVASYLSPYLSSNTKFDSYDETGAYKIHSRSILDEVHAYAHKAAAIANEEEFDLIHAHDWTAYLAGVAAKKATGKPLILHVHATSYDQAGGGEVDPAVFKIEQESFSEADSVVAISNYVKNILLTRHGVDPAKIEVVHNGSETHEPVRYEPTLKELKTSGKKIVLYHGRITIQKGVDYLVRAARKVVDNDPDVMFVISGTGDMEQQIMDQVAASNLSSNFIFAGALWYEQRDRMYQSVDLLVMPSVSEPFGLVPLEAMQHGTPAIISKQSGVSEVMTHALKVDFWDTEEMANQILSLLRYPAMSQQIVTEGRAQLFSLDWEKAAGKVKELYQRLLNYMNPKHP